MIGLMGMLVSCVFSVSARNVAPPHYYCFLCFPVLGRGVFILFFSLRRQSRKRSVNLRRTNGAQQVGSFVVSHITSTWATWVSLTFLLAVHLGTNFKAVTSVALRTLNRQRANIVFSTLGDSGVVVTPKQAARLERIFEKDGVLRWRESEILGYARIGARFTELVKSLGDDAPLASGETKAPGLSINSVAKVFRNEKHLLWYDSRTRWVTICLRNDIAPEEQLKAWVHALFVAKEIRHREKRQAPPPSGEALLGVLETTLHDLGISFSTTVERLKEAGWDLSTTALETKPGYRVGICSQEIPGAGKDKSEIRLKEAKKDI